MPTSTLSPLPPVPGPARRTRRSLARAVAVAGLLAGAAFAQGTPGGDAGPPTGALDEAGAPAPGPVPVPGAAVEPPPVAPVAPPPRAASLGLSLGVSRSYPGLDVRPRAPSGGFPKEDLVKMAEIEAAVPDPAEALTRLRGGLGGALTLHRAAVLVTTAAQPGDGSSPVLEAVSVILGGFEVPKLHALAGPPPAGTRAGATTLASLYESRPELADLRAGLAEGIAAVVSNPRPGAFAEGLVSVRVASRQERWMNDLEERLAVLRGKTSFPAGETPPALDRAFARAYLSATAVAEVAYRAAALAISAGKKKTKWTAPSGPEGRIQVRDAVAATYYRLVSGSPSNVVPDSLGVEPALSDRVGILLSALFVGLVLAGTLGVLLDPPEAAWVDIGGDAPTV